MHINSFPAGGDFCRLLITFADILAPDQVRQNVGTDLDPNSLTCWLYSRKNFLKKLIKKKIHRRRKRIHLEDFLSSVTREVK